MEPFDMLTSSNKVRLNQKQGTPCGGPFPNDEICTRD